MTLKYLESISPKYFVLPRDVVLCPSLNGTFLSIRNTIIVDNNDDDDSNESICDDIKSELLVIFY